MRRLKNAVAMWLFAAVVSVPAARAQDGGPPAAQFKPEELEALVAPIALYPDALLAQVLMASTYPLEIVEAARWSKANPGLKEQALQDALQKQSWDPSVKSLAAFPTVLQMMNEKLDMTQKLGDAFLGQQKDVMDAVQRLRARAQAAGNLKSGEEQTIATEPDGDNTIIKIEPTQPDVVYVPAYSTMVVYGPWPYPMYPPYYYPPPPGYAPGGIFFGFTVGIIIGSAWGHCNWRGGSVSINVNNYNRVNHTNISNGNWQHSPEHRKGVQYRDHASQQKFDKGQGQGAESREAFRGRAEAGQRDIARGGAEKPGGGGGGDRGGGAFDGVGRGGESRDFSDRGAASRGGGGVQGGGGFQGGGRGGAGGGGFHGGGGGGRGGGGRGR
jgi:hypothetical protein